MISILDLTSQRKHLELLFSVITGFPLSGLHLQDGEAPAGQEWARQPLQESCHWYMQLLFPTLSSRQWQLHLSLLVTPWQHWRDRWGVWVLNYLGYLSKQACFAVLLFIFRKATQKKKKKTTAFKTIHTQPAQKDGHSHQWGWATHQTKLTVEPVVLQNHWGERSSLKPSLWPWGSKSVLFSKPMGAVNGHLSRWHSSWLTQAVGKPTWLGFHLNTSDLKTLEHRLTHVTGVTNLVRYKYTSVSVVITHAWAAITYPGVKCEWHKKHHQATVSHLILRCLLILHRSGGNSRQNKLFLQQANLLMRKHSYSW